ncbi:MAG: hypothetical protein GXP50_00765 [Deltaproteobacteria bacterium]|nr:hypothetical protein [Deltaproteobacteria bacterium]
MSERDVSEGRDTSHRGAWFRLPGKTRWHSEAHREYGVLWSLCGVRAIAMQAETKKSLGEEDLACVRCTGMRD